MKVSEKKLLIEPAEVERIDAEDVVTPEEQTTEEQDDLFPTERPQPQVQDFEFEDDFW